MTPCPLCRVPDARRLFEKDGFPYECCRGCEFVTRGGESGPPSYHDYLPQTTTTLPALTRRRYEELLTSLASYRDTGRFLDVGCGGGFLVETARDLGWRAQGTEVSRAAVEFGRDRGLDLRAGALDEVDLPAAAFDLVFIMEVLEHVPDPVALLRQCRELLRPGGALYLTVPNFGSLSRRILGRDWFPICRDHLGYFTPRTARRALLAADLTPVRITSANIQPHEILAKFRRPKSASGGRSGRDWGRTEALRQNVERRSSLRAAKILVNGILRLTGTGDTLRVLAERSR